MRWMILDAKLLFDQHRDARCRPDGPAKPIVLSSFCQQVGQLGTLLLSQFRWWTGRWLVAQRIRTILLGSAHPLAHRAFGHPESTSDVFLFPVLLIEFPGPQSSSFAPVFRKWFFLTHASLHRLVSSTTLDPHAEVNKHLHRMKAVPFQNSFSSEANSPLFLYLRMHCRYPFVR